MKRSTWLLLAVFLVIAASVAAFNMFYKPAGSGASLPDGTPDDIAAAKESGKPFVVKIGSDDCDACRAIDPVLATLAPKLEGKVAFISIDAYKYPEVPSEHRIDLIPSLVYFAEDGNRLGISEGYMNEDEIMQELERFGML